MSAGTEQGTDVIVNEERRPVLYDAKERPLVREVGFRAPTRREEGESR